MTALLVRWLRKPTPARVSGRSGGQWSVVTRLALPITILTTVITIVLPFVGGSGPSLAGTTATSAMADRPIFATAVVSAATPAPATTVAAAGANDYLRTDQWKQPSVPIRADSEHFAQKPVPKPPPDGRAGSANSGGTVARGSAGNDKAGGPAVQSCPSAIGGATGGAPSRTSAGGVAGTTSGDLAAFAAAYNAIRVANCLWPVPMGNIRYDACMETRLFWMAEDPSTDPMSAWGHLGSVRSDGVPSQGCDGNLAGGSGNTSATVAQKWWASSSHRASLYRPTFTGGTAGVCIQFAMTHGGLPNESSGFTRAAAKWVGC